MTIKSDRWIREMASAQGMIDPFEPAQVRFVENRESNSYGTSSYGYDVRCASEFKIFTNVHTPTWLTPRILTKPASSVSRNPFASYRRIRLRWRGR